MAGLTRRIARRALHGHGRGRDIIPDLAAGRPVKAADFERVKADMLVLLAPFDGPEAAALRDRLQAFTYESNMVQWWNDLGAFIGGERPGHGRILDG